MQNGFIKVAAKSPDLRVGDCAYNVGRMIEAVGQAAARGVRLLVFPELAVTGYTCGDLLLQRALLQSAQRELARLCEATRGKNMVVLAGLPVQTGGRLYNCAAVLCEGELLGLVPKRYLPNDTEFYEGRHFSPAPDGAPGTALVCGREVPFGTNLLFACREIPELVLAAELCADLFVGLSPSEYHALAGATVIANLSASDELVSKPAFRRSLVAIQSAKTVSGYVYCSAGRTESTDDVVFSGHCMVAENGSILDEAAPFGSGYAETELDVQRLDAERRRLAAQRPDPGRPYLRVPFSLRVQETALTRRINPYPFLPEGEERAERFDSILAIQCAGLRKRLEHTGAKKAVIGVSGGLDSTLALLVCCRTMREMGRPMTDVLGISMPCFGTTSRTKSNAEALCESLGTSFRTIDIAAAVSQHLADIGHDGKTADVAYENAQARERTQILMDIANAEGGLVIGTGDLSELALGWCTYNGDHMSMYAVNCSVPKTLVRHLVAYIADTGGNGALGAVLRDVLDTPVSPELLPSDGEQIVQKTEDIVGPYELHDFFLYCFVRFGYPPDKIYRLARYAFARQYDPQTIKKWLSAFLRRFFSQQFKRACVPGGPKVGSVSLSPRGDWRMPTDASSTLWMKELEDAQ